MDEKEAYGFIIKLAIEGNNGISSYSEFLGGTVKIEEKKDEIGKKCEVTDETIENAKNKAEKLMKKALREQKKQGELSGMNNTLNALERLQGVEERDVVEGGRKKR